MWLVANNAFLSAVQHPSNPELLIVRSRVRKDLEVVFPDMTKQVQATPSRDYGFRLVMDYRTFGQGMARVISRIDYTNFKASVKDDARHTAYSRIWSIMLDWANRVAPGCNFYAATRVDRSARPLFD